MEGIKQIVAYIYSLWGLSRVNEKYVYGHKELAPLVAVSSLSPVGGLSSGTGFAWIPSEAGRVDGWRMPYLQRDKR